MTFKGNVADAFTLYRSSSGSNTGNVTLTANPSTGSATSVTITFSGSLTEYGSLIDGFYDFTIDATQVSTAVGPVDADGDGNGAGNYVVIGTLANKWFRLFGDFDGDGTVGQTTDFIAFRAAFNAGNSFVFDFNDDGDVLQSDFIAFRARFNGSP